MPGSVGEQSHLFLREPDRDPIRIVSGEGPYLHTDDGRRFLDGAAGAAVSSLGHGNRELAEVLHEQAQGLTFAHPSKFTTGPAEALAEKLVARAPEGLDRVLFASGGSEATETAMKLARQVQRARGHTGKHKIVARRTSYHGATLGALSVSDQPARRDPFAPMLTPQPRILPSSRSSWPYDREPDACDVECAEALERAIVAEGPERVAAFIVEPIVGSSDPGRHPPDTYWQRVREICDRHEVLLIADEVMSGNGRSGRWWAMQHSGVSPDMIATAKGISAGYAPLGAVLTRDAFYDEVAAHGGFPHGHTFAGNPLSCAVGERVIEIIEREGLLARVQEMGALLRRRLQEAFGGHPHVYRIRGRGLLLGVEFVADRERGEPFPVEADFRTRYALACLDEGAYVYQGGGHLAGGRGDHVLVAPPFIIGEAQVEELVAAMGAGLERVVRDVVA